MHLLKLVGLSVVATDRSGFRFRSIFMTVEADAGAQDQFEIEDEKLPDGKRYLFIETARIGVFVKFDTPNDDESMDASGEDPSEHMIEDESLPEPSVLRTRLFEITEESSALLKLIVSDECFEIELTIVHEEIPKLGKFYVELEKQETLEAAEIVSKQSEGFCESLITRYLGDEKKGGTTAPVQITGSTSIAVSSIATDDPVYTLVMLSDKTEVLAEHFQHKGIYHRRQIQLRIPLLTLLGKSKFDPTNQGVAALPLSILTDWGKGKLLIDQDYNEEGQYDKGHLMPSASGAPHNSYLIVPMLQYINQAGRWKQMERKLGRFLYKLSNSYKNAEPYPGEQELAAAFNGCVRKGDDRWNCYLRIIIGYEGADDPRIPTTFSASLNRFKDHMTIEEFGGPIDHSDDDIIQAAVSDELAAVFELAVSWLTEIDKSYEKTGWDPEQPWKFAPRGFPECHVPRPYRALDLLFSSKFPKLRKLALEMLKDNENDTELFLEAGSATIGPGYGFTLGQRQLAILFNRWLNKGKFLSDLRPGAVKVASSIQHLYIDPIGDTELQAWGGNNQAQADHHAPKSTASGTNYFTNLLYISRLQNLRKDTQNKPFKLTNPNYGGGFGKFVPLDVSGSKKSQQITSEETVTRSTAKVVQLTRAQVIKHFLWRWRCEEIVADEFLISVAGNYWDTRFFDTEDPLPWTSDAKQIKKEGSKFFFK